MSKTVISVEHLTKQYDLGVISTGTLTRDLERWWARVRKQPDPYSTIGQRDAFERIGETILALDDVSFTVEKGEALGIIGKNGAGKSTLLKILSRVTAPTSGVVKVKGRIGSLLEVGTGFHPELTGRENVYLNGAILGMKKAEVARKFDEIVAFSGVEKFIDTPVKRYSSGMYVRLAFAVAAHLDPDILIVDEVLAVGDAEFQKKCLGKMGDVAGEGRTVLFVSHNMPSIVRLCSHALLIERGTIKSEGIPSDITNEYLANNWITSSEHQWLDINNVPGDDFVRLKSTSVKDEQGKVIESLLINSKCIIEMNYDVLKSGEILVPNIHFRNDQGTTLFVSLDNDLSWHNKPRPVGSYKSSLTVPPNFFAEGGIVLSFAITTMDPWKIHFHINDVLSFQVIDTMDGKSARYDYEGHLPGVIRPIFNWSTEKMK